MSAEGVEGSAAAGLLGLASNDSNNNMSASANASSGSIVAAPAAAAAAAGEKKTSSLSKAELEKWLGVEKSCINMAESVVLTKEGEPEAEHMKGSTSQLKSIAGCPTKDLSLKLLRKFCGHAQVSGHHDKPKGATIGLIISAKLTNAAAGMEDNGLSEQPMSSNKNLAAHTRLINALRQPEIKALCAKFEQQPSKETLTAGKTANQEMCEKTVEAVNDEETDMTGDNDECDVGFLHCQHESSPDATLLLSDFEKIKDWKHAKKLLLELHKQCATIRRKWKQSG